MTLLEYLRWRVPAAYRQLERSLVGVDAATATAGAQADWRRYRWGVGLDGSIAGIVFHLAAWKHAFADGLESGAIGTAGDPGPPDPCWADLVAWLGDGQQRLATHLAAMTPSDLDQPVFLEGVTMPFHELFTHMLEHDQYHAGQIFLLRQQRGEVLE